jgi:plastocyanin
VKRYFLLWLMVIMSINLVACASDPRAMAKTEIRISIAEGHFTPQQWIVPSGQTIAITFDILDGTSHTFAVLKTQIPGGIDLSAENIFWSASLIGSHSTTTFRAPAMPGEYMVTCLTPGHSGKGEIAKLIVVIPYPNTAP